MPRKLIHRCLRRWHECPDENRRLAVLAGKFMVSRLAMARRLDEVRRRPFLETHPEVQKFVDNLREAGLPWPLDAGGF